MTTTILTDSSRNKTDLSKNSRIIISLSHDSLLHQSPALLSDKIRVSAKLRAFRRYHLQSILFTHDVKPGMWYVYNTTSRYTNIYDSMHVNISAICGMPANMIGQLWI